MPQANTVLAQVSADEEREYLGSGIRRHVRRNIREAHVGLKRKLLFTFQTSIVKYSEFKPDRTLQFWSKIVRVYTTYKICQLKSNFVSDPTAREMLWERQHEDAAEKLYRLCVDLGGFFLKAGQIIAKPDLSPMPWVRKLSLLHDSAPSDPFCTVRSIIEEDFGRPLESVFDFIDETPIGSASVAQVHKGRLMNGGVVAVKVQHIGVEPLMLTDLANLKKAASFLQKFEIKLDLKSMIDELESQIKHEFDFEREARSMDAIRASLCKERGRPRVIVPCSRPGLVSRRVLVMDFIDGVQITRMGDALRKKGLNPDGRLATMAKRKILEDLSAAYGHMILKDGHFQADPHPGNILVCDGGKVALLDYGQTKRLSNDLRLSMAELILAVASENVHELCRLFKKVGIQTQKDSQQSPNSFRRMGILMFDTKRAEGVTSSSPFTKESSLKENAILSFPEELFFVLRTMQLLRGISVGMGVNFSAAQQWSGLAQRVLDESK